MLRKLGRLRRLALGRLCLVSDRPGSLSVRLLVSPLTKLQYLGLYARNFPVLGEFGCPQPSGLSVLVQAAQQRFA